ncbi:uncharacterized protein [Diadema setosum]|uniref:uncharacterized protein n=1 Tax=Diadema setosum TaxID=31175 RepID=UPI003B3AAF88
MHVGFLRGAVATDLLLVIFVNLCGKSPRLTWNRYNVNYTFPKNNILCKTISFNGAQIQLIPKVINLPGTVSSKGYHGNPGMRTEPEQWTCRIPDCWKEPCQNGVCEETKTNFDCHCTEGFTGDVCELGTPTDKWTESTSDGSSGITVERNTSSPTLTSVTQKEGLRETGESATTRMVSESTPDGTRSSTHSGSTTEWMSTVQTTTKETATSSTGCADTSAAVANSHVTADSTEITCNKEKKYSGMCPTGKTLPLPVNQSFVLDIVCAVRDQCGDDDLIWLDCTCCWPSDRTSWTFRDWDRQGDWRCGFPTNGNSVLFNSLSLFTEQPFIFAQSEEDLWCAFYMTSELRPDLHYDSGSEWRCLAVELVDGALQFSALTCSSNEQIARKVCV